MALRTTRTRTDAALYCPACGDLRGRNFPGCEGCLERVEQVLLTDWRTLLEGEGVTAGSVEERNLAEKVVSEKPDKRPWRCVDQALTLLPCRDCRGTLGSGDLECARCGAADAHRWRWTTPDDRQAALRSGTLALRAPHRARPAVVKTWRLCLPFVLEGATLTPHQRRRVCVAVLAGREDELASLNSLAEVLAGTGLPWRGFSETNRERVALRAR